MTLDDIHADYADPALHACGHYIGGRWIAGGGISVINPSTGQTLAEVADADIPIAGAAVDAAAAAAQGWRETPSRQRSEILRRWFTLFTERAEEFALLIA